MPSIIRPPPDSLPRSTTQRFDAFASWTDVTGCSRGPRFLCTVHACCAYPGPQHAAAAAFFFFLLQRPYCHPSLFCGSRHPARSLHFGARNVQHAFRYSSSHRRPSVCSSRSHAPVLVSSTRDAWRHGSFAAAASGAYLFPCNRFSFSTVVAPNACRCARREEWFCRFCAGLLPDWRRHFFLPDRHLGVLVEVRSENSSRSSLRCGQLMIINEPVTTTISR